MRRWQAAKRQQQRRKQPEVRQAHAAAERERRARRRASKLLAGSLPNAERAPPDENQDDAGRVVTQQKLFCSFL